MFNVRDCVVQNYCTFIRFWFPFMFNVRFLLFLSIKLHRKRRGKYKRAIVKSIWIRMCKCVLCNWFQSLHCITIAFELLSLIVEKLKCLRFTLSSSLFNSSALWKLVSLDVRWLKGNSVCFFKFYFVQFVGQNLESILVTFVFIQI